MSNFWDVSLESYFCLKTQSDITSTDFKGHYISLDVWMFPPCTPCKKISNPCYKRTGTNCFLNASLSCFVVIGGWLKIQQHQLSHSKENIQTKLSKPGKYCLCLFFLKRSSSRLKQCLSSRTDTAHSLLSWVLAGYFLHYVQSSAPPHHLHSV